MPPEYLSGVALHPLDPATFVLRYESAGGGFLFSRDGGKSASATPSNAFLKYGFNTKGMHAGLWRRDRAAGLSALGSSEQLCAPIDRWNA